ncbi:OsmC family peroxiredoxin [Mesorhizobium waimense]|uniref:OsmC family peroxiredoxin n=1 Tax=Mesorhizobium waimense TaxID=1300307 RepID=A0A3A5JUK9_9HYPH|nr:OsmC family protein [Mesorhizobium waimense]RJT26721.1 OsmC family peroxiredoxin [Mesorhizobium waimense]
MNDRRPSSELGHLFSKLRTSSAAGAAADCIEVMAGETEQVEGLRSESKFGNLTLTIDEPVSFGGTGTAPNPAEAMLAALGASIEVTIRCYAEFMGIQVTSIGVDLSAELNNQGFFGVNDAVRSGFPAISAKVKIASIEKPDVIAELIGVAGRCCPVLDNVRHPTDVKLSYEHTTPTA